MAVYTRIKKRFYQDSLKLMRISEEVKKREGIEEAFAFMATDINKKTRMQTELIEEVKETGPDDLILLVKSGSEALATKALDEFETKIVARENAEKSDLKNKGSLPTTFDEGIDLIKANLATISVPGTYATLQTLEALSLGMNVHLFSDNVTVEDEIIIKDFAAKKGLLVMGPDCGTSIISGVPICFANKVRDGKVGVIGASGTGLQEFTVLLDASDCGITHAIGTGGRDLSEAVAGRTTLAAIDLLTHDSKTEIITIVSKTPSEITEKKIIEAAKNTGKPTVLIFMGHKSTKITPMLYMAGTIEEGVAKTMALCKSQDPLNATVLYQREPMQKLLKDRINKLTDSQRLIKGLYTGGTLANEAKFILKDYEKTIVDLGDDDYTRGSLHPMIDPSNRSVHVLNAFSDPETAVLLCDVVIGYGSHKDPAGILAQDVVNAHEKTGAEIIVIASVTGTDEDPQNRREQVKKLEEVGIWVFPTNQYAAEMAGEIAKILRKGE